MLARPIARRVPFQLLSLALVTPLAAQAEADAPFPLERGEVVATYSPNALSGPTVILVDGRGPGPIGTNWLAPFFSNLSGPASEVWSYANTGSVFGVAVDNAPNVFVTAGSVYGDFGAPTFGPAGGGGVYRLDGLTADIDHWMVTGTPAIGDNKLLNDLPAHVPPNTTPPGLGDICYDALHDQYFVSNFRDGRIYRVKNGTGAQSKMGLLQEIHDPFLPFPYAGDPLFAPLGERVWAVHAVTIPRPPLWHRGGTSESASATLRVLLFSVWLRDEARTGTAWPASWPPSLNVLSPNNAIFAWEMDSQGDLLDAGPVLWGVMPSLSGLTNGYSNPVADIGGSGRALFFAERTMNADYGRLNIGHAARVLLFKPSSKIRVYSQFPPPLDPYTLSYRVGDPAMGRNSTGGVAVWMQIAFHPGARLWATGDALLAPLGYGHAVYGLQGIPMAGNQFVSPYTATSAVIDLDHDIELLDKSQPGDVEYVTVDAE